jgi:protein TonB
MQRPDHAIEASPQRLPSDRAVGLFFVGLLHVAIITAIATSLAPHIAKFIQPITLVPTTLIPHAATPPPAPTFKKLQQVVVDRPIVTIDNGKRDGITVVLKPQALGETAEQMPITPAEAIAGTHTQPPYPELAIRLGQEGTVQLKLSIGTDGAVTNATVESSSGSPNLDQAAIDWIKAHWRFHPAVEHGAPVAWTSEAAVVFNLKRVQ